METFLESIFYQLYVPVRKIATAFLRQSSPAPQHVFSRETTDIQSKIIVLVCNKSRLQGKVLIRRQASGEAVSMHSGGFRRTAPGRRYSPYRLPPLEAFHCESDGPTGADGIQTVSIAVKVTVENRERINRCHDTFSRSGISRRTAHGALSDAIGVLRIVPSAVPPTACHSNQRS